MTGGKWDKLHEICCRVYSVDGISPCLTTCGGGNQEVKIAVIEDTQNEPKLVGGFGEKKSNNGTQWYQQDRVYDSEEIAMCHPAQIPNGSYNYQVNESENVRIRKLTPKECFRLMDFDDENFEKASKVNSNSQLYKQAGNSIVVAVLEAIFREML